MSMKRHTKAELRMYDGPLFSAATDELNELLALNDRAFGPFLEYVAQKTPFYQSSLRAKIRPRTSDGYQWLQVLPFSTGGEKGHVVILFPHLNDRRHRDGTVADRSIAVYARDIDSLARRQEAVDVVLRKYNAVFAVDCLYLV